MFGTPSESFDFLNSKKLHWLHAAFFLKPSLLTAPTLASEKDFIIIKAAEPAFLSPREDLRRAG